MLFGKRSKLIRVLATLASYNDKGVYWSKHSEEHAEIERTKLISQIDLFVSQIGVDQFPDNFIIDLKSGLISKDDTGCYVDAIRDHFSGK